MKIQINVDTEKVEQFSEDTGLGFDSIYKETIRKITEDGDSKDNLRHPIHGVAVSYTVLPQDTNIDLALED